MTRTHVLEALALRLAGASRVAVDGPDAAGKTTLADELAPLVGASRISADDFLRPAEERYARGPESPEGYYRDSFDDARLRAAIEEAPTPLLVDGVFLQRATLDDLWDVRIWVDVSPDETLRRAHVRDADRFDDVRRRYERRYLPGQRLYAEEVDPRSNAQVVIDNEDPYDPRLLLEEHRS